MPLIAAIQRTVCLLIGFSREKWAIGAERRTDGDAAAAAAPAGRHSEHVAGQSALTGFRADVGTGGKVAGQRLCGRRPATVAIATKRIERAQCWRIHAAIPGTDTVRSRSVLSVANRRSIVRAPGRFLFPWHFLSNHSIPERRDFLAFTENKSNHLTRVSLSNIVLVLRRSNSK